MIKVTWDDFFRRLTDTGADHPQEIVYGVPKGGMISGGFLQNARITHDPSKASIILDDIMDSGATLAYYRNKFNAPFRVLVNKVAEGIKEWVQMPWEADHPSTAENVQGNVTRMLQHIGENPARPGLRETPNRVVRSWDELFSGYKVNVENLFKVFDEVHDEMVVLRNIRVLSMCEHHILPFTGTATVGYLPAGGRVLGLSKIARVVSAFARRLQVQERLTTEIANAMMEFLKPTGVGVVIKAKHACMSLRGIQDGESEMVTSCLLGAFRTSSDVRAEFLRLI